MIKSVNENYILSPILDHKENYDLGGVEIKIAKDYENNLRSRNCQIGIVEVLSVSNPYNLIVGDRVFVNHFTFQGDIGAERSFTLKPHFEVEGKLLFPVNPRNIFFKYNDNDIEPVGSTVIVEELLTPRETPSGLILEQKPYKDRGRVISSLNGSLLGEVVMVDTNALYDLEIKDKRWFKINDYEIAGIVRGGEVYPNVDRVLLEDEKDEFSSSSLDLSMVKKPTSVKAKVIRTGELTRENIDWIREGDTVVRGRNYGVKFNDQWIVAINTDNIYVVMCE